jgi:hypothetical protein
VYGRSSGLPVHENDMFSLLGLCDEALLAYTKNARDSHGISAKDLSKLVCPGRTMGGRHAPDSRREPRHVGRAVRSRVPLARQSRSFTSRA